MTIEKQVVEINGALKEVGDQLKAYAEKSQKEIANHRAMGEEAKAAIDKLLVEQGDLNARLRSSEQLLAKLESGDTTAKEKMTIGQLFARHEDVKSYAGGKIMIDVSAAAVADSVTRIGDDDTSIIAPHRVAGINAPGLQRMTVRDLLNWGTTNSDSIQYVKETGFTNAAATVAENPTDPKPQSSLTFGLETAPVVTIAHWIPASKQVLRDEGQMQSYIDNRLRYGLDLAEEAQLMKGSGTAGNINGLYTQATAYAEPTGAVVTGETPIDRLRLALLQSELAEYSADGIVLSKVDWANIELLKDGELRFLFGNPAGQVTPMLWGRSVVTTGALDAGEFLAGAFAQGAQGWDREQTRVGIAEQHADFFIRNMVAILAEKDIALTVYRPEAFVKGSLVIPAK